ncbi:MAG: hypothetical protein U5L04_16145 [Trueperaceae bacterium]|nr:hypothetical protein [Trueperaceae bacterium]
MTTILSVSALGWAMILAGALLAYHDDHPASPDRERFLLGRFLQVPSILVGVAAYALPLFGLLYLIENLSIENRPDSERVETVAAYLAIVLFFALFLGVVWLSSRFTPHLLGQQRLLIDREGLRITGIGLGQSRPHFELYWDGPYRHDVSYHLYKERRPERGQVVHYYYANHHFSYGGRTVTIQIRAESSKTRHRATERPPVDPVYRIYHESDQRRFKKVLADVTANATTET